jgi:hypothetical protein
MPLERVQILLESGQRAALARRARQTGRSVSDLVREYVQKGLETVSDELDVLENIQTHRQQMLDRRGGKTISLDPLDVIWEIRKERTDEIGSDFTR